MLVKERRKDICYDIEDFNLLSLDEKFLKLYKDIKKYEKENKLSIMILRLRKYIDNLKVELDSLEKCADSKEANKINSFLKEAREKFREIDVKINSIDKEKSKGIEDELINEILLSLRHKLLEFIKEYNGDLNRDYLYHNQLRIDFGIQCKKLKEKFLRELKSYLDDSSKRIKKNINLKSRMLLKEIKLTSKEDINLEAVDLIKNNILELGFINKKVFDIYRIYEKDIYKSFFENLDKLGIKELEDSNLYRCEKINFLSLNKRFIKLVEFLNKGALKNKIFVDIEKFIRSENIENKIEIELLYALDLFKEKYIESINKLILNLKENLEEIVYSDFESYYGRLFSVDEQSEILNNMYIDIKHIELNNFNKITLVDYLNNSKRSKKYI